MSCESYDFYGPLRELGSFVNRTPENIAFGCMGKLRQLSQKPAFSSSFGLLQPNCCPSRVDVKMTTLLLKTRRRLSTGRVDGRMLIPRKSDLAV